MKNTIQMKNVMCVIAIIFLLQLSACGGGGENPPAPEPSPNIAVSSDGEAVAIATIMGSNKGWQGSTTFHSTPAKNIEAETEAKSNIANLIISKIEEKLQNDSAAPATEKSVSINITGDSVTNGPVLFNNEVIVTSETSSITLNGAITVASTADSSFSLKGTITGEYADVPVTPTVKEKEYNELINGAVTLTLDLNFDVIQEYSNNFVISRAHFINGDVGLAGSDIEITGTANGKITTMNPSMHITNDNNLPMTTCSGAITAQVGGSSETCNLLSTCDGCE